jgi:hypothetical protein
MKFLLTLYGPEGRFENASPEEMKAVMDHWAAYSQEAVDKGTFLAGEGLEPSTAAATVRFEGGDKTVTDGPFAETKEQLGGFYLLECKDLDEAIEWARKIPYDTEGAVEVRPVMDYQAAGYEGPMDTERVNP